MHEFINKLVAHRGYRSRFPENSVSSILAAIEAGAKHIEFDVQMNADHDLVLLHDDDFYNTAGLADSIFETRTTELDSISVHEYSRFGDKFYPEPVPLLREILQVCLPFKDVQLFVEIKEESLNHWGVKEVMSPLIEQLSDFPNPVCMISFDENAVAHMLRNSDLPCGWVLKKYDNLSFNAADVLAPDFLICNQRKIPADGPLHEGNWQWMLYGITKTEQLQRFSRQGCDLFETDFIGELISEIKSMEN